MPGIDLLNLNPSVIIQLVLFLALIIIINVYLFSPMVKVLAKRHDEMDEALKRDPIEDEAEEKEKNYRDRLQKLRGEGTSLLNRLRSEARAEEHRLIDQARHEASNDSQQRREQIHLSIDNTRKEILAQVAQLASEAASIIAGRKLQ